MEAVARVFDFIRLEAHSVATEKIDGVVFKIFLTAGLGSLLGVGLSIQNAIHALDSRVVAVEVKMATQSMVSDLREEVVVIKGRLDGENRKNP